MSRAAAPAVVITGMGCVSGLGVGMPGTWGRVIAGQGAIATPAIGAVPVAPVDRAAIDGALAGLALRPMGKLDPLSAYALVAGMEAVTQAGLEGHAVLQRDTAILIGCGSGGNATVDIGYERLYGRGIARVHPQTVPGSMISAPASHLSMLLGVHGPAFVIGSACASSAHALGEAMHMIRAGRVKVAIAGGAEACLNRGSMVAWESLGVLASDTCRPFSRDRKGMVLGEGAAVLVLEEADHAAARGAPVLGEIVGYGASADAAHITAPDRAGIELAIRAAYHDAGAAAEEPALIAAHGTGTPLNDVAETAALRAVYGDGLGAHRVIATKSAHGHMIGAAGAIGFAMGMTALRERMAPPVLNYLGPDRECELPLVLAPEPMDATLLVANSFAFGGLNAVLIGRSA